MTELPLSLRERRPWLTYAAAAFIAPRIARARVFEWGAGGSTLWFADRGARSVDSVEHDAGWAAAVRAAAAGDPRVRIHDAMLRPGGAVGPDHANPDHYASVRMPGVGFQDYAGAIDRYPPDHFDIVLIDGRSRCACFRHGAPHVAPGGLVILDDSVRPRYAWCLEAAEALGWTRHDFEGPGPYDDEPWRTTVWTRPRRPGARDAGPIDAGMRDEVEQARRAVAVRPERPHDHDAVHRLTALAFGRRDEADLVDRLRAAGRVLVSLVAEEDGRVVGHVLFSPVVVTSPGAECTAVGLAPLAVWPDRQRRGIGSALVGRGLDECRRLGHARVVVLGHPAYYGRFGFRPASRVGVRSEFEAPDDAFMALALHPGAWSGCAGVAAYAPEFRELA